MTKVPHLQPVYASINKPLTIGGADRRLFFVALVVGGATFTLFGSLLAGLLMFLALYLGARSVTQRDPQLLRIVLRSAAARRRYDPGKFEYLNYANALLRYAELEQQYAQLVTTYQQIRTQYLLLRQQAQAVPVDMNIRYRSIATPWLPFNATDAYGTTAGWILTANNGHDAAAGYALATQTLGSYGGAMAGLSADERARLQTRYDRTQLTDASITHGLEALGFLRGHQPSVEAVVESLEEDTYSSDPSFNTQIAVLNKLNAT